MENITSGIKRLINGTEDNLSGNLSRAADDLRDGVHDAKEHVTQAKRDMTSAVHDAACEVGEAGSKAMTEIKHQSDRTLRATGDYIQRNPVQCALGGIVAGFILSKFLFKR